MKHTPGPWKAVFPETRRFHNNTDITTYEVLSVKTRNQLSSEGFTHYRDDHSSVDNVSLVSSHFWRDMNDDEAKANARLIASAPELLEALKAMVKEFGYDVVHPYGLVHDEHAAIQSAIAAIAKAEGV